MGAQRTATVPAPNHNPAMPSSHSFAHHGRRLPPDKCRAIERELGLKDAEESAISSSDASSILRSAVLVKHAAVDQDTARMKACGPPAHQSAVGKQQSRAQQHS